MSLLGGPLLVVVGVAAVLMPVVTILAWSRVRGPRWAQIGQRGAIVLTAQFLALAFGFVSLNDYGQFFTTWGELLGTASTPKVVAVRHFGAQPSNGATGRQTGNAQFRGLRVASAALSQRATRYGVRPTAWSSRSQWRTRGAVMSMPVNGPTTGLSEPAFVYLPPSYFTGARHLPVVEVLSGYPGSSLVLVDRMNYPAQLIDAIDAGAAQPMVLVMLRPSVTVPRDTECTNVPHGPQAFSYFSSDVPTVVDRVFNLSPTAYAVAGQSTGGLCAAKLAVMDPTRFRAAVSLSGYYRAITDFTTGNLYGNSTRYRELNDVMWRLTHLPPPRISLLVGTSKTETGADGYATAQRLLQVVRPPMSADEIVLNHGGHNFWTWRQEVPIALRWLSKHFPPVAPTA